ncbi:MAG: hypothetical protein R2748_11195 [Bryobacterales bacterium]
MIRSLVEGVSYSLKDCLDIVESLGVRAGRRARIRRRRA